ncbi:MAG: 3-alpha,7-alpha,12-alpha-trihydroxy-5-beta-cholest-24-enoyl-CoA hydratase [Chloroflexi bacterium]|nr:3-alpha,7-alpha,12-alpha-trihydroxy-5-beta-cholest-24-enoyl-CoA hydratase [Chloroflexota bacterium]
MKPPSLDTVEQAIGAELLRATYSYAEREAILYALGVGAPAYWLAPDELKFVHELQPDFQVLPTFAVIFAKDLHELVLTGNIAGIKFNPMQLVHGEQELRLAKPLPRAAVVDSTVRVADIHDKGSGLLLALEVESRDEAGGLLAQARSSMFIRGLGGFGGDRGATRELSPPERPPDAVIEAATLERQALIYRLSGDANPLHVDPRMAAIGNFEKPILHGLCTLGFSARAILKGLCGNDAHRLVAISARFAHHVFPGETLVTEMWRNDAGEIRFQTKAKERDAVVLSQASAQLRR